VNNDPVNFLDLWGLETKDVRQEIRGIMSNLPTPEPSVLQVGQSMIDGDPVIDTDMQEALNKFGQMMNELYNQRYIDEHGSLPSRSLPDTSPSPPTPSPSTLRDILDSEILKGMLEPQKIIIPDAKPRPRGGGGGGSPLMLTHGGLTVFLRFSDMNMF